MASQSWRSSNSAAFVCGCRNEAPLRHARGLSLVKPSSFTFLLSLIVLPLPSRRATMAHVPRLPLWLVSLASHYGSCPSPATMAHVSRLPLWLVSLASHCEAISFRRVLCGGGLVLASSGARIIWCSHHLVALLCHQGPRGCCSGTN